MSSSILQLVACVLMLGTQVAGQDAPSPPTPRDAPELTIHRAPRALAAGAVTQDWPCFLGPSRDGRSAERGLLAAFPEGGPACVWELRCGEGYAGPVVAEGRLVFTHRIGDETHVDCLDAETGRRYWRFTAATDYRDRYLPNGGPRSTPVIHSGVVVVHDVEGVLRCLDLEDGTVRWSRDLAEELGTKAGFFGVVSSPLVHEGRVIQNVGAPGGPCVAAFDIETGRLAWGAGDTWGASCASPVIAELHGTPRLLVLGGGESRPPSGGLMVIDPASGAVLFEHPFRSRTYESVLGASPVVVGPRIILTASYNTGTACILATPDGSFEEAWSTRRLGLQFSNPIVHDGLVYAIDGRSDRLGAVVCLDPATGEERSRTDLAWDERTVYDGEEKQIPMSVGEGSLLAIDGRLLCLGDNGHLLWLEPAADGVRVVDRTWLFRANESWTRPVVSRGLLYVRQNKRERFGVDRSGPRLLCFDLRGGG